MSQIEPKVHIFGEPLYSIQSPSIVKVVFNIGFMNWQIKYHDADWRVQMIDVNVFIDCLKGFGNFDHSINSIYVYIDKNGKECKLEHNAFYEFRV